MRKLATLLGYTVEVFQSAADFLESHLLPETACLVADVHMPQMSGVELHGHLIAAGYAIPTILVTAYPDDLVRDRALKLRSGFTWASRWTIGILSGVFVRL